MNQPKEPLGVSGSIETVSVEEPPSVPEPLQESLSFEFSKKNENLDFQSKEKPKDLNEKPLKQKACGEKDSVGLVLKVKTVYDKHLKNNRVEIEKFVNSSGLDPSSIEGAYQKGRIDGLIEGIERAEKLIHRAEQRTVASQMVSYKQKLLMEMVFDEAQKEPSSNLNSKKFSDFNATDLKNKKMFFSGIVEKTDQKSSEKSENNNQSQSTRVSESITSTITSTIAVSIIYSFFWSFGEGGFEFLKSKVVAMSSMKSVESPLKTEEKPKTEEDLKVEVNYLKQQCQILKELIGENHKIAIPSNPGIKNEVDKLKLENIELKQQLDCKP